MKTKRSAAPPTSSSSSSARRPPLSKNEPLPSRPTPELDIRAVNKQVLQCTTPAEVLRLFVRLRSRLDVVSSCVCLTQVGVTWHQGANNAEQAAALRSEAMGALRSDLLRTFASADAAARLDTRVLASALHSLARLLPMLRDEALFHACAVPLVNRLAELTPRALAMLASALARYRSRLLTDGGGRPSGDSMALRISNASVSGVCAASPPFVPAAAAAGMKSLQREQQQALLVSGSPPSASSLAVFRSPFEPSELVMLAGACAVANEPSSTAFARIATAAIPLVPYTSSSDLVALVHSLCSARRGSAARSDAVNELLMLAGSECALRLRRQAAAAATAEEEEPAAVPAAADLAGAPLWQQRMAAAFQSAGLASPLAQGGAGVPPAAAAAPASAGARIFRPGQLSAEDTRADPAHFTAVEVAHLLHSYAAVGFRSSQVFDAALGLLLKPLGSPRTRGEGGKQVDTTPAAYAAAVSSANPFAALSAVAGPGNRPTSGTLLSPSSSSAAPRTRVSNLRGEQVASIAWALARTRHGEFARALPAGTSPALLAAVAADEEGSGTAWPGGGGGGAGIRSSGPVVSRSAASTQGDIWRALVDRATELLQQDELTLGISSSSIPTADAGGPGTVAAEDEDGAGDALLLQSQDPTSDAARADAVVKGYSGAQGPSAPHARVPRLRSHHIATICWAATSASVEARGLVRAALLRVGHRSADFSVPATAHVLWSAALQGVLLPPASGMTCSASAAASRESDPAVLARCIVLGLQHVIDVIQLASAAAAPAAGHNYTSGGGTAGVGLPRVDAVARLLASPSPPPNSGATSLQSQLYVGFLGALLDSSGEARRVLLTQSAGSEPFSITSLLSLWRGACARSTTPSRSQGHVDLLAALRKAGISVHAEHAAIAAAEVDVNSAAAAAVASPTALTVDVWLPRDEAARLLPLSSLPQPPSRAPAAPFSAAPFPPGGIAIEMDGPSHYLGGSDSDMQRVMLKNASRGTGSAASQLLRPTLKTTAKRRWLEALGYRVVPVSWVEWSAVPSSEERLELLAEKGVPVPRDFLAY